jgi:hypothetical protein
MSYTEIYKFKSDGNPEEFVEVRNAHRGAMAVWDFMEKKYLPPVQFSRMWGSDRAQAKLIWDLARNEEIGAKERICMLSTYDDAIVYRKDIPALLEAFRSFPSQCSLPEQADAIETLYREDPDFIAIGWNQTSVNGDDWMNFGGRDEDDEYIPYNILTDSGRHWSIFAE